MTRDEVIADRIRRELTLLRRELPWLAAIHSTPLAQALRDLDKAFAGFFAGRSGFPRFQSRDRSMSFRHAGRGVRTVEIGKRKWAMIRVPKVGRNGIAGEAMTKHKTPMQATQPYAERLRQAGDSMMEVFVYPAERYAPVDADVAKEREGGKSAGAVAREMSRWAGIHSAENLRWMLDEMLANRNRDAFKANQVRKALKALLFALHARPMPGYPLLTVEDAIAQANEVLDAQLQEPGQ